MKINKSTVICRIGSMHCSVSHMSLKSFLFLQYYFGAVMKSVDWKLEDIIQRRLPIVNPASVCLVLLLFLIFDPFSTIKYQIHCKFVFIILKFAQQREKKFIFHQKPNTPSKHECRSKQGKCSKGIP